VAVALANEQLVVTVSRHMLIAFLIEIGILFGVNAVRKVPVINVVGLFAFTFVTGLVISPVIAYTAIQSPGAVGNAAFLTLAVFGGLTAYEAVSLVRALQGLTLVGADVMEVSPLYDGPGQVTALLAANLLFEFVSLLALQHGSR
jgi:FtsH-binding integral membrane protein